MNRYFVLSILLCLFLVDFNLAVDRKKDCKCRLVTGKKIIGGKIANKLDYRWQVSIAAKDENPSLPEEKKVDLHRCGGVILNERWILTVGRCSSLIIKEPNNHRIGLATNDLVEMYDNNNYVEIEAAYSHPNYISYPFGADYDIGLIKTASKINFTDMVQPACMDFEKTDLYNGPLRLTGWGSTDITAFSNDPKQSIPAKKSRYLKETINYDVSNNNTRWDSIITNNEKTKSVACIGDTGGPLHSTDSSGKIKVIGLTGFFGVGIRSGGKTATFTYCIDKTTLYTRVSAFKDFVEEHIGQDYCV